MRKAIQAAVVALVALILSGCSYNKFTSQEEAVKSSWSEIQNQLQRQNDLIPNLVETVKGYSIHEQDILKDIAESRSRLLAAKSPEETMQASNQATTALGRLLAISENYPNLKANEQFNNLMFEIAGTQNRITVARKRYNDNVQAYNTSRHQFPGVITNKMFGFKDYPYFEAPPSALQTPKVDFGKK